VNILGMEIATILHRRFHFNRLQEAGMPANSTLSKLDFPAAVPHAILTLVRPYKGVTLRQDLEVLSVCPDAILAQACGGHILGAPAGTRVHLYSPNTAHKYVARLAEYDDRTGVLLLTEISRLEWDWKERLSDRVQPGAPLYGTLHYGRWTLRVCLEDISVKGAGVLVHRSSETGNSLRTGVSVWVEFDLPDGFGRLSLRAAVAYLRPVGATLSRVGLRFSAGPIQTRLLERYTSHRRQEILDELARSSLRPSAHKEAFELYF
jgi:hypothetical protein